HVAEGARLGTIAEDGDGQTLQGLNDEVRDDALVARVHAWAVGIEDPRNLDADAVLPMVVKEQRFSAALAFVVASARADRVDVAPVGFGLRVNLGIAVHLAG